jgi:hypothetical protein
VNIETIASALKLVAFLKKAFTSLAPIATRLRAITDIEKLADDFFSGESRVGSKIRLRGILFPYACSVPNFAYRPRVMGSAQQTIKGNQFNPKTGRMEVSFQVTMPQQALSPPASRLNDVTLIDGSKARIAWLYREDFNGLIFQQEYPVMTAGSAAPSPADVLRVAENQQPILCLLPVDGSYDSRMCKIVEVAGDVFAAEPVLISPLGSSLDQFQLAFLSRCIRPFENGWACLALDLRGQAASVTSISNASTLNVVIGVQGLIDAGDLTDIQRKKFFVACADAIPDRAGMGPLRAISDPVPKGVSGIISAGEIRWVFDENAVAMGAFKTVNLADREETVRSFTQLSAHWQAWQKHARRDIAKILRFDALIRPIFVSARLKFRLFHEGGLQLPPRIEQKLFHQDAAIRDAVDWLAVGTGKYEKDSS